jgi:hypothetical protein
MNEPDKWEKLLKVELLPRGGTVVRLRLAATSFLKTKSGLVDTIYLHTVALAEWDWATGRYFQFSKDTAQNVH